MQGIPLPGSEGPGHPSRFASRLLGKGLLLTGFVVFGAVLALAAVEAYLRYGATPHYQDEMDPGLIVYDRHLGWAMAPYWTGRHRHTDFDVAYNTNARGFRGRFGQQGRKVAYVGDSFTFGLGVEDEETFVSLLQSPDRSTWNLGVIGYSTDQEALLIERKVLEWQPDEIVLAVYLGNDLFDNERAFPLQGRNAKPFFRLEREELHLENTPVPLAVKPPVGGGQQLLAFVMGDSLPPPGRLRRLRTFGSIEALLGDRHRPGKSEFDRRFTPTLALYDAILQRIKRGAEDVPVTVVLIGGRSYVEQPESDSARYQAYFLEKLSEETAPKPYRTVDVATPLRADYQRTGRRLYFPNDGHLNVDGHRQIADVLRPILAGR